MSAAGLLATKYIIVDLEIYTNPDIYTRHV